MYSFETFVFILSYPLVPIIAWVILLSAKVRPFRVSLSMVFVWSYLVFAYLGLPLLYFKLIPYRVNVSGINDPELVLHVFLLSTSNLILLCFGVAIGIGNFNRAQMCITKNSATLLCNFNKVTTPKFRMAFWFIVLLSALVIMDYLRKVPNIALIASLTEAEKPIAVIRSQMTSAFPGRLHWYRLFYSDILSFCSFLAFSLALIEKKRRYYITFLLVFLFALFSLTMSGQKAPVAWFLIGLFLTWLIATGRSQVPLRIVFGMVVVTLSVLVVTYILFMGSKTVSSALGSVFSRVFTGQMTGAYHYLRIFPEYEPYLLGRSFPNPRGILPYEVYPLTRRVMNIVHPELVERGIIGSMPTVFWGEIHANYGPFVAAFIGFPLGILLGLIDRLFRPLSRNPETIAFYVWVVLFFRELTGTGLSTIFIPTPLIILGVIYFWLKKWRGFHKSMNHGVA